VPDVEPDWPPAPAEEPDPLPDEDMPPDDDVLPDEELPPELPDEEPPLAVVSHLFAAHLASVDLRPAHFGLLFLDEAPDWDALFETSPLLLFIVEDEEPLEPVLPVLFCESLSALDDEAPDDPAMLPLLVSMELPALLSPLLLVVLPVVLALWLVVAPVVLALSFLCFMSPIAKAEVLAMAMIDVTTNAGASLRILPPIGL